MNSIDWLQYGALGVLGLLIVGIFVTVWKFFPMFLKSWKVGVEIQSQMMMSLNHLERSLNEKMQDSEKRHAEIIRALNENRRTTELGFQKNQESMARQTETLVSAFLRGDSRGNP